MVIQLSRSNYHKPQKAHLHPPKGCVCTIWNKSTHGFARSAPETKCGQKSGIINLIMTDGRPIKPNYDRWSANYVGEQIQWRSLIVSCNYN